MSRGYVLTQTGTLAAERYQQFLTEFEDQLAASPVVDAVSHDHDLPLTLFEAGDVAEIEGPYELFARISDIVGSGAACRIVLPTVFDSRHVRVWHSQVVRGDRTIELFADEGLLEQLAAEFPRPLSFGRCSRWAITTADGPQHPYLSDREVSRRVTRSVSFSSLIAGQRK